MAGMLGDHSP